MNAFVDNHKRGVELPAGCKDLFDVLQRARLNLTTTPPQPDRPRQGFADIKDHLIQLLCSAADYRSLWIEADSKSMVGVFCDNKRGLRLLIVTDASRDNAVRQVLSDLGISPLPTAASTPRPLLYSLPLAPAAVTRILITLLTEGLSLSPDTVLRFRYGELSVQDDSEK
jgi:hypothetical protein